MSFWSAIQRKATVVCLIQSSFLQNNFNKFFSEFFTIQPVGTKLKGKSLQHPKYCAHTCFFMDRSKSTVTTVNRGGTRHSFFAGLLLWNVMLCYEMLWFVMPFFIADYLSP